MFPLILPSILLLQFLVAFKTVAIGEAFVAPTVVTSVFHKKAPKATSTYIKGHAYPFLPTILLSDDFSSSLDVVGSNDLLQNVGASSNALMETVTSVLAGIFGIIFFLVGLTYIMAAIIIPQAAKQLEQQTKELDPALWAEYQSKLEPGQTIDQRPDLMQELGEKMQKRMEAKFNEQQQQQQAPSPSKDMRTTQVLDAEIMSKDTTNKAGSHDDPWRE